MTVTTLEIIQAENQLWRNYLSNRTVENKTEIESYEKLEWILNESATVKEPSKEELQAREVYDILRDQENGYKYSRGSKEPLKEEIEAEEAYAKLERK